MKGKEFQVLCVVILLLSNCPLAGGISHLFICLTGVLGAGSVAVAALPLLGFTSSGIAAGSIAAKMMSASALASGGGVVGGGMVSYLQSVAAGGISGSILIAVGKAFAFCASGGLL